MVLEIRIRESTLRKLPYIIVIIFFIILAVVLYITLSKTDLEIERLDEQRIEKALVSPEPEEKIEELTKEEVEEVQEEVKENETEDVAEKAESVPITGEMKIVVDNLDFKTLNLDESNLNSVRVVVENGKDSAQELKMQAFSFELNEQGIEKRKDSGEIVYLPEVNSGERIETTLDPNLIVTNPEVEKSIKFMFFDENDEIVDIVEIENVKA